MKYPPPIPKCSACRMLICISNSIENCKRPKTASHWGRMRFTSAHQLAPESAKKASTTSQIDQYVRPSW